ncbi:MAG: hypothetical protein ACOC6H_03735 [Thermoproteota archaeon]
MGSQTLKRKNTDQVLLEVVREHPGLSQYELGKRLEWSPGRVDGAVRRMLNSDQVFLRVIERNGRTVNLVHPTPSHPLNTLRIPRELYDKMGVGETVWFYALDRSTIGVATREMPDWKEHAGFTLKGKAGFEGDKVDVRIPEKMVRFYHLEEKYKTVSSQGDFLLITVSGNIVENKNYPS